EHGMDEWGLYSSWKCLMNVCSLGTAGGCTSVLLCGPTGQRCWPHWVAPHGVVVWLREQPLMGYVEMTPQHQDRKSWGTCWERKEKPTRMRTARASSQ
ncbi:hypothetical protein GOODEAATRI_031580, partial [Goodea atripinnis]